MSYKNRVLICPLNWGLGHATRDVPIIQKFINLDFEVIIAADGISYDYLKKEFPALTFIVLPGYRVEYSKWNSQLVRMLMLIPKIFYWTFKEYLLLKSIVSDYNIDIIVSDNRFGLRNRHTYNIFITHQLKVKFPGVLRLFELIYQNISNVFIKKFDECWVPDFEGESNLSGELSHTKNSKISNIYFVNPLSRFLKQETIINKDIDILFILSGPEPQRSILEKIIEEQSINTNLQMVLVRGSNTETQVEFEGRVINVADTSSLNSLLLRSNLVICRSGYTSVMDLFILEKNAVLVPTPGQTEQEYLAKYLNNKGFFYSMKQKEFSLKKAIENIVKCPKIEVDIKDLLHRRIEILKQNYNNRRYYTH